MTVKIKIDNSREKSLEELILCPKCRQKTKHSVMVSVNKIDEQECKCGNRYESVVWGGAYQIIKCLGCEEISFRIESSFSEDYEPDGSLLINETLYPKRLAKEKKRFHNLPSNIKRIYIETIDCYNSDSMLLCGIGIRTLIESICLETDGNSKDCLVSKINGLAKKGIVTVKNAEILHQHRFLGNDAAHQLIAPSKREALLAIEIAENILMTLYEIPKKADELKKSRDKKRKRN